MNYDVAMQDVVKRLDITCVAGGQPAGDEGRILLHASIVSAAAVMESGRTPVDPMSARLGMVALFVVINRQPGGRCRRTDLRAQPTRENCSLSTGR